ncbi:MAG: type II secretion pathway protein GspD [Melioribacteraceae bacterium]|nr:MAG: type II secretion pathway protein GspD [Melioribacteraceae bacterium]
MMKTIVFLLLIFGFVTHAQSLFETELSGYVNPEDLVSLSENLSYNEAIEMLNKVSMQRTGKRVVSRISKKDPIGLAINNQNYKRALYTLAKLHGYTVEETSDLLIVTKPSNEKIERSVSVWAPITSREVKISAVFFEANITDMKERGINWSWLLSKSGLEIGTEFITTGNAADEESSNSESGSENTAVSADFNITNVTEFEMGDFSGSATSIFRFFESENLGEVIARPSITVRDQMQGRIQIGSDISIKQRDFAGNVTDQFISTGTIIEVTPYIYNEEGNDYVLLQLQVERSSANPDVISTEIRKTTAQTQILMLDGEETIIGGLFVTEETNSRRGIPILKDLPWWVLGIRYLTGYTQKIENKKEVIIVIKTEIVPTLRERLADKKEKNLVKEKIMEDEIEMMKYKGLKFNNEGDE